MACIALLFSKTMTAKQQYAKILYIGFYPPRSIGRDSEIILEGMPKYISVTPARTDV
jgi:hypothetical protein